MQGTLQILLKNQISPSDRLLLGQVATAFIRAQPRATVRNQAQMHCNRVQPSAKFKKIQINFAIPIIIYTFAIPKRDDSLAQ